MNVAWTLIADLESRGARFEDRGRDRDGVLVSVAAGQAAVVLDSNPGRCVFFSWREVAPQMVKWKTDAAA